MSVALCTPETNAHAATKGCRGNWKPTMVKLKCKTCKRLFPDEGDMRQPWLCIDCRPGEVSRWLGGGHSNPNLARRDVSLHFEDVPSRTVAWEPAGHVARLREEDREPAFRLTKFEDMDCGSKKREKRAMD